jgi:hypothetical protein
MNVYVIYEEYSKIGQGYYRSKGNPWKKKMFAVRVIEDVIRGMPTIFEENLVQISSFFEIHHSFGKSNG